MATNEICTAVPPNKALHRTAFPLRAKAAGELWRWLMNTSSLAGAAMNKPCIAGVALLLILCGTTMVASAESPFMFESVVTLDDMSSLVKARFPLGTSHTNLRRAFVEEGHATLKIRAGNPDVEKYIYDIDLCHYYVWRWKISADYDASGQLRQA